MLGTIVDRRLAKALEGVARRHLARQVPDPELRKKLTPSYTIGCKRITDRRTPTTGARGAERGAGHRPDRRDHERARSSTADGTEREIDTIVLGDRVQVFDNPGFPQLRGRDRRHPERGVAGQPARLPRHRRRRLSESLLPRRAEQRPAATTRSCSSSEAHINYVLDVPARDGRSARSRRSRCARGL